MNDNDFDDNLIQILTDPEELKKLEEDSFCVDEDDSKELSIQNNSGFFNDTVDSIIGQKISGKSFSSVNEKLGIQTTNKINQDETPTERCCGAKTTINSSDSGEGGGGGGGGGGGCSGGADGVEQYKCSDGACHASPCTPKFKLEIEENDFPENWWDKLPDFDPRVYDAIMMEQAEACVNFIHEGLPEMHDLRHKIEARKFPKYCPRLKVCVPRTKILKPKEIIYDTKIDAFIKKDVAY